MTEVLPTVMVRVEGMHRRALVDIGYSQSIAHASCCKAWTKGSMKMLTVNEEVWQCEGTGIVQQCINARLTVEVSVRVTPLWIFVHSWYEQH